MRLTETLQIKISREMREAVEAEAERLHVRTVDLVRMAIAEKVAGLSVIGNHKESANEKIGSRLEV